MTNSIEIAEQLQRRCKGDHEHQWLTGKRASEAARYPEGLCRAICIGLMKELRNKDQKIMPLFSVCHDTNIGEIQGSEEQVKRERGVSHVEDDRNTQWLQAWDDLTGEGLDPKEVRKARLK